MQPKRLAAALLLALATPLGGAALAQASAPRAPEAADQQALDAARAELDAAARRYAELAQRHGGDPGMHAFEMTMLRKPVIGVVLAPATEGGVRIAGVTPGSAAASAGLASGDRIVAIDGKPLPGSDADARVQVAREAIARHDTDSKVQLRYVRAGREASVTVAPRVGDRVMFFDGTAPMAMPNLPDMPRLHAEVAAAHEAARATRAAMPMVRREVLRLVDCANPPCNLPVLAEALRWNGLNLASLDQDLGGYFGTDKGVLVVSAGDELEGLRAGDVIQSVDGKPVASPRELMEALRGRDTGARIDVGYLRNRHAGTTVIRVPEPMRFPLPPPAPAPPAPPAAPTPPAAPAPPAPPID